MCISGKAFFNWTAYQAQSGHNGQAGVSGYCPSNQPGIFILKKYRIIFVFFLRILVDYQTTAVRIDLEGQTIWPGYGIPLGPPSGNHMANIKCQNEGDGYERTVPFTKHSRFFKLPAHNKPLFLLKTKVSNLNTVFVGHQGQIDTRRWWKNIRSNRPIDPPKPICIPSPSTWCQDLLERLGFFKKGELYKKALL